MWGASPNICSTLSSLFPTLTALQYLLLFCSPRRRAGKHFWIDSYVSGTVLLARKADFLLLQAKIWEINEVSDIDQQIYKNTVVWIDAMHVEFVHTWLEKPAKVFLGFYWEVNVDAKSIYHIFGYVPLSHMTFSSLRAMNTFLFHYKCLFYFNPFLTNPLLICSMSSSFSPCSELNVLL